jgi:predicted Zn-dependent protease
MNTKIKTTELPEAVQAYVASGYDPSAMSDLMDLLQEQTDYIQKRFWKMVDSTKA